MSSSSISPEESKEVANQRIQQLRERLELYNATIAEAMNVVSGTGGSATSKSNSASGSATATAAATVAAPAEGARKASASSPLSADTGKGGRPTISSPLPAPRTARDLNNDFTSHTPNGQHRKGTSSSSSMLRPPQTQFRNSPPPPPPPRQEPQSASKDARHPHHHNTHSHNVHNTSTSMTTETSTEYEYEDDEDEEAEGEVFEYDVEEFEETASDYDSNSTGSETEEALEAYLRQMIQEDPSLQEMVNAATSAARKHYGSGGGGGSDGGGADADDEDAEDDAKTQNARTMVQQAAQRFREQYARARESLMHDSKRRSGHEGDGDSSRDDDDDDDVSSPCDSDGYQSSGPVASPPAAGDSNTKNKNNNTNNNKNHSAEASTMDDSQLSANPNPWGDDVSFAMMDRGYQQLQAVQQAAERFHRSMGVHAFPKPLPQQERSMSLAKRFDELAQEEASLRGPPAPGMMSLERIKTEHCQAVQMSAEKLLSDVHMALESFAEVQERRRLLDKKRRLLEQRRADLSQRRQARATVDDESKQILFRNAKRLAHLKEGEAQYVNRLKEHAAQEEEIQGRIAVVEELSSKVSTWLHILEERDGSLTAKEEKLRRVQADLSRRSSGIAACRNVSKRTQPPPPPPPRIGPDH